MDNIFKFDGLSFDEVSEILNWQIRERIGPCQKFVYTSINGIMVELYEDGHWNIDIAPNCS